MPTTFAFRRGLTALVALCLVWSYTWVIMKEGLRYAGPFDFAALRTLPGALLMFAAMAALGKPFRVTDPGRLLVFGLFQTTGFNAFVSWALLAGAAGKTAVLVYTFPFWTLLFAWPMLGERVRGTRWLAVALAALGLTLVLEPWHLAGTLGSKLLALGTAICWAISAVLAKKWRTEERYDLLSFTAWQMLFGSLVLLAIALVVPSRPIAWTPYFAWVLLYAIVFGTVTGWLLWLYVLERLPAGVAGLSIMAVPALGVLFSHVQLGEQPGGVEVVGMVLIGASLAVLWWLSVREKGDVRVR